MIHVLITVKESTRFPGKNRKLAPYTILWLLNEMAYSEEPVRVYTVGDRSELPFRLPQGWTHLRTDASGHCEDIKYAESIIAPAEQDVMVLAQVTQPLREHGLLERVVRAIRRGASSCITAKELKSQSWRALEIGGKWSEKETVSELVTDGCLYAWRPGHSADIFKPDAEHAVVKSHLSWGLVDVDTASDIPPALKAMAAELLLEPMYQPPLVLKNRKVLLIGSGADLNGRKLGKRIDAGEWDVVVRCNHYYGSPEDVGTRTDLAMVRLGKFEKDFMNEAPCPPVRVIATNDGANFPREVVLKAAREVGHTEASCGVITARWLLNCGARLSVIGIGHYEDGSWIKQKTYPDGTVDTAGFCDWKKENAWWQRQRGIELL